MTEADAIRRKQMEAAQIRRTQAEKIAEEVVGNLRSSVNDFSGANPDQTHTLWTIPDWAAAKAGYDEAVTRKAVKRYLSREGFGWAKDYDGTRNCFWVSWEQSWTQNCRVM